MSVKNIFKPMSLKVLYCINKGVVGRLDALSACFAALRV